MAPYRPVTSGKSRKLLVESRKMVKQGTTETTLKQARDFNGPTLISPVCISLSSEPFLFRWVNIFHNNNKNKLYKFWHQKIIWLCLYLVYVSDMLCEHSHDYAAAIG